MESLVTPGRQKTVPVLLMTTCTTCRQGPFLADLLGERDPAIRDLAYFASCKRDCLIATDTSRTGYTGERA
jgi:hypothetical protein